MYLFIIKPQQKKAKDQADLLTNLKPGDEVVTAGGIIGKVRSVAEQFITLEVSQNTSLKVLKSAVQSLTKAPPAKA
jgi:preprotein translocase subunit YajC